MQVREVREYGNVVLTGYIITTPSPPRALPSMRDEKVNNALFSCPTKEDLNGMENTASTERYRNTLPIPRATVNHIESS